MPLFIRDTTAILFIHIPKTGGSSIEAYFRDSGWEEHFREGSDPQTPGNLNYYLKNSQQHLHAPVLSSLFAEEKIDFNFTLVRHPVDRALSAYKWHLMRENGRGAPPSVSPDDWWERSRALIDAEGFQESDNHLRPQIDFLLDDTKVFKFEDGLQLVRNYLEHHYRLNPGWLNRRFPHRNKSSNRFPQLEFGVNTIESIHHFYEEDLERFEYV